MVAEGHASGTMSKNAHNLALSQETRSWVENCLVPILIKEYLDKLQRDKVLDTDLGSMAECPVKSTASAEVEK